MLVQVHELPNYQGDMPQEGGRVFMNWVQVTDTLFRSSAPYYKNEDSEQKIDQKAIDVLKSKGINQIVSLNYDELNAAEKALLTDAGIRYVFLKVEDFQAPTVEQLKQGAEAIDDEGKVTLVYCGYGQGRTGTMITAWQILSLTVNIKADVAIAESTAEKPAQEEVLRELALN